jgi:hypothetical protein
MLLSPRSIEPFARHEHATAPMTRRHAALAARAVGQLLGRSEPAADKAREPDQSGSPVVSRG